MLIAGFPKFLAAFERSCPFTKCGPLEFHLETVQRRQEVGSVAAAVSDVTFLRSLYRTLEAWGSGSRRSRLRPFKEFVAALQDKTAEIQSFENLFLDQSDLDVARVSTQLAHLIQALEIVDNRMKIVPGTKALRHSRGITTLCSPRVAN